MNRNVNGMARLGRIARRSLLVGSAAIAGGVAFGTYWYRRPLPNPLLLNLPPGAAALTPYVLIDADGITLITPRADFGQGAASIQADLIAEELDIDPQTARLAPGMPSPAYYNQVLLEEAVPFPPHQQGWLADALRRLTHVPARLLGLQITGGSSTVADGYERLRLAGAVARETIKQAAAQRFGVARPDLGTADGHVILPDGRRIPYTSLAAAAAGIEPVTDVTLRSPAQWQRLGTARRRSDIVAKSTGAMRYGIDLAFAGMLHAAVRTNPARGAGMRRFDASRAAAMPGVRVVPVTNGVGVLADSTWRARRAVDAIAIDWEPAGYPGAQDEIWRALDGSLSGPVDGRSKDEGDVEAALADPALTLLEAEYRVPYLAHAPLEPLNATVRVSDDRVEVWTGTQVPGFVQQQVAELTGIAPGNVHIYAQPIGGSFGHRLEAGYVLPAVELALAARGSHVKLTLSREEDMAQEHPRPAQIARMRGAVAPGEVRAFDLAVAGQSVTSSWLGRLAGWSIPGADATITAGAGDQPLAIPDYRVTGYRAPEMVPVSPWRSVGASACGFLHGGFLDELFAAAGLDPMNELIRLCTWDLGRQVLERLRSISAWDGRRIGDDRARGVAFTVSFGVPMGQVVEVRRTPGGIRIERVFAACDVGPVLDPVNLEAQVQGGIIWGLGHAMNCELTYRNFAPTQTNFHAYQGMRIGQAPEIVVSALGQGDRIRGIGEPAVPPAAAALANAIFALTGQRLRELPLNRHVRFA